MSLWLLVDGYNVIAPTAPPAGATADWLQRERELLISRLVAGLAEEVRVRTCVVFDAANPPLDRPHAYTRDGLAVRYAVGYSEADDLLEELISGHHSPKQLAVVSSDRRVQAAARRRRSVTYESQEWFDALLDGRPLLAAGPWSGSRSAAESEQGQDKPAASMDADQVAAWLKEFDLD